MSIGARILEIRKSLNLTQERFANILGVNPAHISKIEANKGKPSELFLNHICCRFFISKEWLVSGQGEMMALPEDAIVRQLTAYGQQALTDAFFNVVEEYGNEVSLENSLKSLLARFGEQDFLKAVNSIMKERGLAVAAARPAHRADTGDPDLDRLLNDLYDLWSAADNDMKGWIKVQFRRAFPDDVIGEAQKKQKETLGQASAG